MSHNFDFEFDDGGKNATARAVGLLFGGALLTLSAVTSAAFFWQYAPDLFAFVSPTLSPDLAAVTGVGCFEACLSRPCFSFSTFAYYPVSWMRRPKQ